jgi:hypothetical protein
MDNPKVVIRKNGGGKSSEMIKLCATQGGYIVVTDRLAAVSLVRLAESMDLRIPFPITLQEIMNGRVSSNCEPLWFDDLDAIAARLARGAAIGGWSATDDDRG